jgi:hypothetical protein
MYRLNGGPWIAYSGPVAAQPQVLVEARSVSTNPAVYADSAIVHTTYYNLVPAMTGNVSAQWMASTGPSGMVASYNNSNPDSVTEIDGSPASGYSADIFNFQRVANFANVAPNTAFKLGTINYSNGTVYTGTAATALDLRLTFVLTTPPEAATSGDVHMGLVSTTNSSDSRASADQCTLVTPLTNYSFVYGGVTYTLKISWGSPIVSQGWVSGDVLYVYEGATAVVDVLATFVSSVPQ